MQGKSYGFKIKNHIYLNFRKLLLFLTTYIYTIFTVFVY